MNAEQFFKGLRLSEKDKLSVINYVLPGLDVFLEEILAQENLSEKGEKIRLDFVALLDNLGSKSRVQEIHTSTNNNESQEQSQLSRSSDDLVFAKGYAEDSTEQAHWPEETAVLDEKETADILPCRKGTDSTEESGIFPCSSSLPQLDATAYKVKDSLNLPMLDSVDAWSPGTIISETGSAEIEVVDGWESDVNGQEEGYFTGDNVFVDFTVCKLDLQPNEFGELYSGVMYIREHPGWHKRWFSINDQCLTCFRHRSETKMLFQIPLKGAKIIPTDRKKSRMFPITLSVPRIHETITFATTEEQSRQEWLYVVNYVISKLIEDDSSPDSPENQPAISYDTYLKLTGNESSPNGNNLTVDVLETYDQSRRRKLSGCLNGTKIMEPNTSWTHNIDDIHSDVVAGSSPPWNLASVEDEEDESSVMNNDLAPGLDEDESFRELQEILPDIIQGCKIPDDGGKKKKKIFKAKSSNNVGNVDNPEGSFLSASSCEGKSSSVSDLQSPNLKVKRHGSLVNSLSSKALRVKSRITDSFFKKGRKDDIKTPRDLTSFQSTTFSGYLLRKKGPHWKNRWCVVKEHSLFCYKDFGIGTAEIQVPLHGASIKILDESNVENEKQHMFVLTFDKEELLFATENDAELEEWIMVLNEEIKSIENSSSPVPGSPEKTLGASPTASSVPGSPSLIDSTEGSKKNKDSSPVGSKKASIFSSIGHKLTKSKPKPVPGGSLSVPIIDATAGANVEDGFVLVEHSSNVESNSGSSAVAKKPNKVSRLEVATSHTMEGFLNQRVEDDTWLKCWVKLENHTLHIHDDKDSTDSVVVKIKLSNCVVKDWIDEKHPYVMEIRRTLGRPHYLQAQSESEYKKWKSSIDASIVHLPKSARRPALTWSSVEDDRTQVRSVPLLVKAKGDSIDRDDVFQKAEDTSSSTTGHPVRPNTPLNPSPRPSTAGDVSNSESDEAETAVQDALQIEPVERWRSFSEGEQEEERKTRSKLHRSISNVIPVIAHFPGKRKRRSRTVPNVNVSPDLIVNVKHSSCLFMRNGKGLWPKRWCVLQEDKLHVFRRPDEVAPVLSIPLAQCEIRRSSRKTIKFSFEVNVPSEKEDYCFAADTEKEMLSWIRLLRVIAEEEDTNKSFTKELRDIANGDALHDSNSNVIKQNALEEPATQSPVDIRQNESEAQQADTTSPVELYKNGEVLATNDSSEGSSEQSPVNFSSPVKPTSLDDVLKLLQDQRLIQHLGQQKFDKVKKAQRAWQRSAAVALKEHRSGSVIPDMEKSEPTYQEEARRRTLSASSSQAARKEVGSSRSLPRIGANEIIEQFEKLAEEERSRTLKKETLLKKRRNSLTLEKDVLKRKMTKGHEKKNTVKKLLGKDETASNEDIQRVEERLQQVNRELATIEKNLMDNKMIEAQALDNINVMKTKTVRKHSFVKPSGNKMSADEKRSKFKTSPSESTSSQGSTEETPEKDSANTPQTVEAARKQSTAVSLAVLEKELRKISPVGGRRITLTGEPRHGRVSWSSEGSQEDSTLRDSPIISKKTAVEKRGSEGSAVDQSTSLPSPKVSDSAELRRKKFSTSGSSVAFHNVSVEIPTEDENKQEDEKPGGHRLSSSSERSFAEMSRKLSVNSERGSDEQRASLMNALSQIKDFEDFAAISKSEKWNK